MPEESMSIILNSGAPMLVFNFSLSEKNIVAFRNGVSSFGLFAEKKSPVLSVQNRGVS
jgi:hypothetical protein